MAELRTKNVLITVEAESTYGTDPTPTSADAVQTKSLNIFPYGGDTVSRDIDRTTMGAQQQINVKPNSRITFEVELAGSGAAGTEPNPDKVFEACGLAGTTVASTSVTYDPISTGFSSVTIYFYYDGQIHKISGMRGNVSLNLSAGGIPTASFDMLGLHTTPVTGSLVTPTYTNAGSVLPVTNTNTPTFSLDGVSTMALASFTVDFQNLISHQNLVNKNEVFIGDREVTGQITILATDLATKDWFAKVRSDNGVELVVFQLVHGTSAGNIITINGPTCQLTAIENGELNGIGTYEMGIVFLPSAAGNDEIDIAYT